MFYFCFPSFLFKVLFAFKLTLLYMFLFQPLPPMRKKEQVEAYANDSGPSKHQLKKQKKAAKRNARTQKARRDENMEGCLTILEENVKGADGAESGKVPLIVHLLEFNSFLFRSN